MATTPEKKFQADLEAIRSDIAALTENVGKLVNELFKAQGEMAKTVGKAARTSAGIGAKMWDEAADLGHDTTEAVTDAAHIGMSNVENRIKHKPLSAILVAFGIGVVLGVIGLHRRN